MAGTTTKSRRTMPRGSDMLDLLIQFNKLIDDLATVFGAIKRLVSYTHENLAAGADIAARAIYQAPVAETILDSVKYIPEAASAGIDGSNTLVITLRNITEGVDIATVTRTTDLVANTPIALTLTGANADIAAGDVLGIVVTQGAAADVATGTLQFESQRQTLDAAADLLAAKVGDHAGTAITE